MKRLLPLPRLVVASGLAVASLGASAAGGPADAPATQGVTYRVATGEVTTRPALPPAAAKAARLLAGRLPASGRETDERAAEAGKVFGGDDRFPIADPTAYPWSTVARVVSEFPDGSSSQGSAILVGDRYALTAGHVVHDVEAGGFATTVEIVPASDGFDAPFGRFEAAEITSFTGWTRDEDYDYDFALLRLDGIPGDDTGWLGLASYSDGALLGLTVNTGGYPGDLDDGLFQYGATGTVGDVEPGQILFRGTLDAAGGQSGSGVWVRRDDGRYVLGVVSSETTSWNRAARVTAEIYDSLVEWMDTGPDFVLEALNLTLPAEFEPPEAATAFLTVANEGDTGETVEVALHARDGRGLRTLLDRREVFVGAFDDVATTLSADFGTGFPAGTYVLEADVNGDRAVFERDLSDNRRAGPTVVVLPPFQLIAPGAIVSRVLAPGGVVRYSLQVDAGRRLLRLGFRAPRRAYAYVTPPGGEPFVIRPSALGRRFAAPAEGTWTIDVRLPTTVRVPRRVTIRTVLR